MLNIKQTLPLSFTLINWYRNEQAQWQMKLSHSLFYLCPNACCLHFIFTPRSKWQDLRYYTLKAAGILQPLGWFQSLSSFCSDIFSEKFHQFIWWLMPYPRWMWIFQILVPGNSYIVTRSLRLQNHTILAMHHSNSLMSLDKLSSQCHHVILFRLHERKKVLIPSPLRLAVHQERYIFKGNWVKTNIC